LLTHTILKRKKSDLLVERGARVELLTDEAAHGNVRDFQKLREPLGVHASLDSSVPYQDPLDPSPWDRPLRPHHAVLLQLLLLLVVIVGVVLELSRGGSVRSDRQDPYT
jgi:hypothetical protein